ncbi:MAG: hypothetical protein NTY64_11790 [Deltaproteobacteria bacterium]|nr:hypothetical protein [Deltaproteobacteria bacterium]
MVPPIGKAKDLFLQLLPVLHLPSFYPSADEQVPIFEGFVKSPSAALRFTFVAAAYHPSTPHSPGFARRVPRNAEELFTWPAISGLFTRSSIFAGRGRFSFCRLLGSPPFLFAH